MIKIDNDGVKDKLPSWSDVWFTDKPGYMCGNCVFLSEEVTNGTYASFSDVKAGGDLIGECRLFYPPRLVYAGYNACVRHCRSCLAYCMEGNGGDGRWI